MDSRQHAPLPANPVGDLLRGWRNRRAMSQADLAFEAGISIKHLSYVETGKAVGARAVSRHRHRPAMECHSGQSRGGSADDHAARTGAYEASAQSHADVLGAGRATTFRGELAKGVRGALGPRTARGDGRAARSGAAIDLAGVAKTARCRRAPAQRERSAL